MIPTLGRVSLPKSIAVSWKWSLISTCVVSQTSYKYLGITRTSQHSQPFLVLTSPIPSAKQKLKDHKGVSLQDHLAMAEKNQNQYNPPESNGYQRNDQESLHTMEDEEAKRKKRMKWTIGIIAFVILQVVQALFFVLVIMKFKSPKFRVTEFDIQTLNVGTQASPSFDMSFVAPIRVKNTNWGPFKYDASIVSFTYGGIQVGQAIIPKSKANFKSTKKIDVPVTLKSDALPSNINSNLGNELSSGVITLNSQGELKGKITVMFMFKKTKISQMNCSMRIDTLTKVVQSLSCN